MHLAPASIQVYTRDSAISSAMTWIARLPMLAERERF